MITSQDYDHRILAQGLQFQIDHYYQPKERSEIARTDTVLQFLKPGQGETILDIGCGVGTLTFHSARRAAKAFGIDYSLESLKAATQLCAKFGVGPNTRFILGNSMNLPFKNGHFDKIVSADFIEHITDAEKDALVKEMYRVLKPQGVIIIFTPNSIREKIGEFYWRLRNALFADKIPYTELHYGLTYAGAFTKICRKNGFSCGVFYKDLTRPYLAAIPLARRALALNLLFTIEKLPAA